MRVSECVCPSGCTRECFANTQECKEWVDTHVLSSVDTQSYRRQHIKREGRRKRERKRERESTSNVAIEAKECELSVGLVRRNNRFHTHLPQRLCQTTVLVNHYMYIYIYIYIYIYYNI